MSGSSSITVRPTRASDFENCVELDRFSTTDHVWQMVFDDREDALAASFRPLRESAPGAAWPGELLKR